MNRKMTSKAALVAVAVALVALLAFCLAACDNEPAKPVLGVTVHSQQAPYSPDGAKPFTDGTQADVTGLPEGYTLQIGLTAEFDGIPQAGESAPLVWDGTVKVMNGDVDVTAEFDVQVTIDEGATFTVVKADMDFGNLFVGTAYDGKAHSFNEFAEQLMLPDGAEQTEYTVKDGDETYTAGGEYPVEITFAETANYNEQTVIGRLCIRTFADAEGNYYSISEASAAAAKSAGGLTVYMFEDTAVGMDTVVGDGLTVVLRDTRTSADGCDNSDEAGKVTYNDKKVNSHVDGDPDMIEFTLSIEDDAELRIDGAVIVSGILGSAELGLSGHTSGTHSVLSVEGSVAVADGGVLDVRGYVRGDGTVEAFDGSTVYLPFVVYDFRGGTNTAIVYRNGKVIPFNTFDMFYNLQTDAEFMYGSVVISYMDLYAMSTHNFAQCYLITTAESAAAENAFFLMEKGSVIEVSFEKGEYSFDQTAVSGTNEVTLAGNIGIGDISLKVQLTEVNLSNVSFAVSHRIRWNIGDGETPTEVVMPHDYKILPGGVVTVARNAAFVSEGTAMVYSEFEDTVLLSTVVSYPSDLPAGKLVVNGSLIFADGAAFGGRIVSETSGATVTTGADFTPFATGTEGNSGKSNEAYGSFEMIMGAGDFVPVFIITEAARFDAGILAESTDEAKVFNHNDGKAVYNYTERIRKYDSESPIRAGRTYTYDAESGTWK